MKSYLRTLAVGMVSLALLDILLPSYLSSSQHDDKAVPQANAELVLLPADVRDAAGNPVRGLTQNQFEVRGEGKLLPIEVFSESGLPAISQAREHSTSRVGAVTREFSNVPAGGMPQQLLIVALDLVNTGFDKQAQGKERLLKYLSDNLPDQPFELVAITQNGLIQIHSFGSADKAGLLKALQEFSESLTEQKTANSDPSHDQQNDYANLSAAFQTPSPAGPYAWQIAARASLQALQQIAQAYSGVPGRKSVLWLTAGIRVMALNPTDTGIHQGSFQFQTQSILKTDPQLAAAYDDAFRELNTADIAIYPVDLKELKSDKIYLANGVTHTNAKNNSYYRLTAAGAPGFESSDGLKIFAQETGGEVCSGAKELANCIQLALQDASSYYLIGLRVPQLGRKPGWQKLEIKLTSQTGKVRSRSRYYLPNSVSVTEDVIRNSLLSVAHADVAYTGLLFSVERVPRGANAADDSVTLRVRMPVNSVLLVPGQQTLSYEIATASLADKTASANAIRVVHLNLTSPQTQEALAKGWRIEESWSRQSLMAGVKYVIRDNGTGRIGSVSVPAAAEGSKADGTLRAPPTSQ